MPCSHRTAEGILNAAMPKTFGESQHSRVLLLRRYHNGRSRTQDLLYRPSASMTLSLARILPRFHVCRPVSFPPLQRDAEAEPLAGANGEDGSGSSNSAGSFQSFQVGEEDLPSEVRDRDDSDADCVSPHSTSYRPSGANKEPEPDAARAEDDDVRTIAGGNERHGGDEEVEVLPSDVKLQRSCPAEEGRGKDPRIERKGHDGLESEERAEGVALSSRSPTLRPSPPEEVSDQRRQRVRFAMGGQNEYGGGDDDKGKGHREAQEDETALLLPVNVGAVDDSSTGKEVAQARTQQHLGISDPPDEEEKSSGVQLPRHLQPGNGILQGTTTNAVVEDEDFMVDDIDDESSTLLNPSRIVSDSAVEPEGAHQSEATLASTGGASSSLTVSSSTLSSPAMAETAPGASVSAVAGELVASGVPTATPAAAFNYLELPPSTKDAPVRGLEQQQQQKEPARGQSPATVAWHAEGDRPSSPSRPRLAGDVRATRSLYCI